MEDDDDDDYSLFKLMLSAQIEKKHLLYNSHMLNKNSHLASYRINVDVDVLIKALSDSICTWIYCNCHDVEASILWFGVNWLPLIG